MKGEGTEITGPTDIAVDWLNNIAFVNSGDRGTLYSVDLNTGERKWMLQPINRQLFQNE
ncbi:MAG: hypothetical protein HRT35_24885 [Algicola sp.]|nr:hypothetical protein [Algicola sp.]